jgi:hypothetical protein
VTEPITGWIWTRHVRAFLELLSHYAGYGFDPTDWQAVEPGIEDTDDEQPGAWYAYPLVGKGAVLEVRLAQAVGTEVVSVQVAGAADHDLRVRVRTLLDAYAGT